MQNYLETVTTYFVDPHGTPDDGGTKKRVVKGKHYDEQYAESLLEENQDKSYSINHNDWLDEDDWNASEDGYNSEYECSELKPITDEEAIKFEEIINAYNNL